MKLNLWRGLPFWKSGEWQVVDEALKDLDRRKVLWSPGRKNLFKALELTPMDEVRCVLLGQDPYPNPMYATGLAFDTGLNEPYPATLQSILAELKTDLDIDHTGDLSGWAKNGVLLWNVIPSCEGGKSLSHNWTEYKLLTQEILQELSKLNIVFAALGSIPRSYRKFIDETQSEFLYTDHPSPRAGMNNRRPFKGSRLFSTINVHLSELGHKPIDWSL